MNDKIVKNVNDEIYPLEKIIDKNINYITFKDSISLIFHAAIKMSKLDNEWADLYGEFQIDLGCQNKIGWPSIEFVKNNKLYRMDISKIDGKMIQSKNIFMLIFQLLFIENSKRFLVYKYKIYKNTKMLWHKIESNDFRSVKILNLGDIFIILSKYIKYYLDIYNDETSIEYLFGKSILDQLE